ncbi:MAG TPA: DUF885 domain-containing protein [Candidatus Sulfotelmatobacter sp.]|nr:DUF885 domain-containing protein [Candidatus Sulfotelmatobacter sp.]
MRLLDLGTCFALAFGVFCSFSTAQQSQSSVESRRKALNDLLAEQWEYKLRTSPIFASFLGDKRWNDKLDDFSQEAIDRDVQETQKFLTRFEAIDTSGFPEQEALNKVLMVRDLQMLVESARFKSWEMPVSQQSGIQIDLPDLVNVLSFQSVKDYEDYVSRLQQIPRLLDQTIIQMRKGMNDKLMPPRFLLEKVVDQSNSVSSQDPEKSPFAQPFLNFPKSISESDQKRLREAGLAAIKGSVLPAYGRFTVFVRDEYVPKGRTEPGIWSLPDGAAMYRHEIRRMTTTDLTPQEIHEIGLKQVDETEAEMLVLAHKLGFKDLASLNDHIKNDRRFYATSGQQVLDLYATYVREMEPELPKLFGRLPKAKLAVIPMEAARSKNAVPADYTDGAADGSRPGHINVNEWDPEHRLVLNIEAIAYHEGIPGHHLQLSLAQELTDQPAFRKYEDYTAFVEGWALYSERLGKEVGRYQDPYSDYGRLENEMWRAIRLVIDTGVHEKHWSRDQMVAYFHRYTAMDEPNVQSEVDRYIAWPGQALAYKLGQLEILKLRQYAKDQMGEKFDIRSFHDELLDGGALPLDVLDTRIHDWVAKAK